MSPRKLYLTFLFTHDTIVNLQAPSLALSPSSCSIILTTRPSPSTVTPLSTSPSTYTFVSASLLDGPHLPPLHTPSIFFSLKQLASTNKYFSACGRFIYFVTPWQCLRGFRDAYGERGRGFFPWCFPWRRETLRCPPFSVAVKLHGTLGARDDRDRGGYRGAFHGAEANPIHREGRRRARRRRITPETWP